MHHLSPLCMCLSDPARETQRTCFPSSSLLSGPKSSFLSCPVHTKAAQLPLFTIITGMWPTTQVGWTGDYLYQSCPEKENAALWRLLAFCIVASSQLGMKTQTFKIV